MNRICFESAGQKHVHFEKTLSATSEIALHNLVFRRVGHSLVLSSRLRFYLWVTKSFSYQFLLPEVDIYLNFDYYADFDDLKIELEEKLIEKTQHLPEKLYYEHFLTRIENNDGYFCISKNDNEKVYDYAMEIELDGSLKKYLNITSDRVYIDSFGFQNDFPIYVYTPLQEFNFQCVQLEKDPILDKKLRSIFVHAKEGEIIDLHFENIFFRRLQNSAYKTLTFEWNAHDFRLLSYGIIIRDYTLGTS